MMVKKMLRVMRVLQEMVAYGGKVDVRSTKEGYCSPITSTYENKDCLKRLEHGWDIFEDYFIGGVSHITAAACKTLEPSRIQNVNIQFSETSFYSFVGCKFIVSDMGSWKLQDINNIRIPSSGMGSTPATSAAVFSVAADLSSFIIGKARTSLIL
jgi:hypothetical protein